MNYPILQPAVDNTFIVTEEYVIKGVAVPAGYKTNGADIPRIAWSYIAPNTPKYMPAIVVHDYLCDEGEYEYADKMFEEILLEIENSFKTRLMVKAVKLYTRWIR